MKMVVSLDEFRKNLAHIVAQVMYGDQTVLVKKHNKTGVVVISEREYKNLQDPKRQSSSEANQDEFFILADKVRTRMSTQDQEKLEEIIDDEVKAVRAQKERKKI